MVIRSKRTKGKAGAKNTRATARTDPHARTKAGVEVKDDARCKVIARWVEAYRRAWGSNDPREIGALFAAAAVYRPTPFSTPWRGRPAIVREWLARKDPPGSTVFRYEVLATRGGTGIVRGWTRYRDPDREYTNIWLLRLDPRGRCREFTEWWMQRPG